MPAPIVPPSITNALPYSQPLTAQNLTICDGLQGVSMTFAFNQNPVSQVTMSSTSPQNMIQQIAALYVDASQSTHDISIYFPDTQFMTRIAFGKSQLFPVLTTKKSPPIFYVLLDDNGNTSASDICTVIALNKYVPEFDATSFQDYIAYGYGANFELQPTFTQSAIFSSSGAFGGYLSNVTIISASQWYVTGIQISIAGFIGDSGYTVSATLTDSGSGDHLDFGINTTGTGVGGPNVELSGLNWKSAGGGSLLFRINQLTNAIHQGTVFCNILGGILMP